MATAEMKSRLIFSLAEPNRCTYSWLCHIHSFHTALAHSIYSRHFNVAHCGEDTALFNRTVISMLLIRIFCEKIGKKLIEN